MLTAGLLSLVLVGLCVVAQHEATVLLLRHGPDAQHRRSILAIFLVLLATHILQVCVFAGGHVFGERVLGLGHMIGNRPLHTPDIFYFSAESFTTLGIGDIYATSNLRMLTSVESLAGMLFLSWSAGLILIAFQKGVRN